MERELTLIDKLQRATGYDEDYDSGVDSLIEYKNVLEDAIGYVEDLLRANGRGDISAADVCGDLWNYGFDPTAT